MRNQLIAIAGATALTVAGVAGFAAFNEAEAQGAQKPPVILVVDQALLVSQSKAGKTIPDQAQIVAEGILKELEAEQAKLNKDIENYQKNASLMSEEVRQKTEQELAMRTQYGLPQQKQIANQAVNYVVQSAQAKVLQEARPILKDIIDKRGATVIFDSSTVLYAAVEVNITQEVLAELDKKLTKVDVEKISLAEVEKQLKEAQAKALQAQAEQNKKK